MPTSEGFARRVEEAWFRLQAARGRMTHGELGALVGAAMGGEAVHQTTVGRWFRGSVPDLPVIEALAKALGVTPSWLAFGYDGAPAPAAAIAPGTPAPIILEGMGPGRVAPSRATIKRRRDQAG